MSHKPIKDHNLALLEAIRAAGTATSDQMADALGVPAAERLAFDKRLRYLSFHGWTRNTAGKGQRAIWQATDRALTVQVAQPKTPDKPQPVPYVGQVAAPRHINVLRGPVYRPAPSQPTRDGACDALALPSLVSGRRVWRHA